MMEGFVYHIARMVPLLTGITDTVRRILRTVLLGSMEMMETTHVLLFAQKPWTILVTIQQNYVSKSVQISPN